MQIIINLTQFAPRSPVVDIAISDHCELYGDVQSEHERTPERQSGPHLPGIPHQDEEKHTSRREAVDQVQNGTLSPLQVKYTVHFG